jgi:hypothetical protein
MALTPARGHSATCQWCGKPLTGKAEKWCSSVCRSSASRRKHSEAIKALAAAAKKETGKIMPKAKAAETVKAFGLPVIEAQLNGLGWVWYPKLKAFYFDGVQNWRAA